MKLNNPLILRELRKFYFEFGWSHCEVQRYLFDHYGFDVNGRTLKRWKKLLFDVSWVGPKRPVPPKKVFKASCEQVNRICRLRRKTGGGFFTVEACFQV